jgi:hypothetical protein
MKPTLLIGILGILGAGLAVADSDLKTEVTQAVKRLAAQPNYSWTTSFQEADGSPGRLGPINGRAAKNGLTFLSFWVGSVPVEVYMQGEKGTAKALEDWQTFEEIARTGATPAAVVRFLRSYKAPVAQAADLANHAQDWKAADDALAGALPEEAVKELLLLGMRPREGHEPPKTTGVKGAIKFWLKDGALTKYEIHTQGKVTAGERTWDIDRITTVEIKDVGATPVEPPEAAKQKLL